MSSSEANKSYRCEECDVSEHQKQKISTDVLSRTTYTRYAIFSYSNIQYQLHVIEKLMEQYSTIQKHMLRYVSKQDRNNNNNIYHKSQKERRPLDNMIRMIINGSICILVSYRQYNKNSFANTGFINLHFYSQSKVISPSRCLDKLAHKQYIYQNRG